MTPEQAEPDDLVFENWREIPHHPDYQISDKGRIRRNGKLLKLHLNQDGYLCIRLSQKDRKPSAYRVHRLVLEAFKGPCPEGMECAHLDAVRHNNFLENLSWVTPKENAQHRILHGNQASCERHGSAKLNWASVRHIRLAFKSPSFDRCLVAILYGISPDTVTQVVSGKTWKRAPFISFKRYR